LFDRLSN